MKTRVDKKYGLYSFLIFTIIVLLSFFVIDKALNKSIGNILFVVFIYSLTRTFFDFNKKATLFGVGLFCLLLEFSKISDYLNKMNLADNPFFENLLGNKFDFDNIWSIIAACAIIYLLEFYDNDKPLKKKRFPGF